MQTCFEQTLLSAQQIAILPSTRRLWVCASQESCIHQCLDIAYLQCILQSIKKPALVTYRSAHCYINTLTSMIFTGLIAVVFPTRLITRSSRSHVRYSFSHHYLSFYAVIRGCSNVIYWYLPLAYNRFLAFSMRYYWPNVRVYILEKGKILWNMMFKKHKASPLNLFIRTGLIQCPAIICKPIAVRRVTTAWVLPTDYAHKIIFIRRPFDVVDYLSITFATSVFERAKYVVWPQTIMERYAEESTLCQHICYCKRTSLLSLRLQINNVNLLCARW